MDTRLNEPQAVDALLAQVSAALRAGELVPYLGAESLLLDATNATLPLRPEVLVERLVRRVAVPSRIRRNLTAAAQYIENFRHRKVLRGLMQEAFSQPATATVLHRLLAELRLPLIVDTSYDDALARLLRAQAPGQFGEVQGVSRADVRGDSWVAYFDAVGGEADASAAAGWPTVLYKPLGAVQPAGHFLVSDSDYVEVLTEIDIQTPIPPEVQARRSTRGFLFLGCRFRDQLARTYARQIMKRSAGPHYAVLPDELSRNEARFVAEQGIRVVPLALAEVVGRL